MQILEYFNDICIMERFKKQQPEENSVDISSFLQPVASRTIQVTDYALFDDSILQYYWPSLFSKDGKPKRKLRMYVAEE